MSHSNNFHIGYGNYSTVYINYRLIFWRVIIRFWFSKRFNRWLRNADLLKNINTNGVDVWFDKDNKFNAYDYDDCGVTWSLSDFVKYCGNENVCIIKFYL